MRDACFRKIREDRTTFMRTVVHFYENVVQSCARTDASQIVELAISLPLLLVIVVGIIAITLFGPGSRLREGPDFPGGALFLHTLMSFIAVLLFVKAIAAVKDSHSPGVAGLWVSRMKYVQIAGVKPPKSAAATLCAREKPDALTSAGMISVRYTTIPAL